MKSLLEKLTLGMNAEEALEPALAELDQAELSSICARIPAKPQGKFKLLKLTLWLCFTLSFLWMVFANTTIVRQLDCLYTLSNGMSAFASPKIPALDETKSIYSKQDEIFIYGDPQYKTDLEKKYHLWKNNPEVEARYVDYILAYNSQHSRFPAGMLRYSSDHYPENGLYLMLSASAELYSIIEKVHVSRKSGAPRPAVTFSTWTILDKKRYQQALTQLEQAWQKPIIDDKLYPLYRQQLKLMAQGRTYDYISRLRPIVKGITMPLTALQRLHSADLFNAKFSQFNSASDPKEVKKWIDGFYQTMDKSNASSHSLIDGLVYTAMLQRSTRYLHAAALNVGLDAEAKQIQSCIDQLNSDHSKRILPTSEEVKARNTMLNYKLPILDQTTLLLTRKTTTPVALSVDDFAPERYATHSFLGRILTIVFWIIMVVILFFAAASRFSRARLLQKVSARLLTALRPRDWLIIVLGGTIAPITIYLILNRFTPASAREWNISASSGALFFIQFLSAFLAVLVSSILLLRHRLSRRLVGIAPPLKIWAWLALASCYLSMLLIGLASYEPSSLLSISIALLSYSLLWILINLFCYLFKKRDPLYKGIFSQAIVPIIGLASIVFALLVPLHHMEEKYWVAHSKTIDASIPFPTIYEHKVADQLLKEVKQRIDLLPH